MTMATGETETHLRLKGLATTWATTHGFAICASEVRVPRSGYRADVAACSRGPGRRTAVFECKQARADLLKDAHAEETTRQRVAALQARRKTLEELLALHRPDLRRGDALFPEFDALDLSQLEHQTHRRVVAELAAAQEHLRHGTKFAKMFRYRSADFLYLVVEDGIFAEAEIPAGWGLLVRRGEELALARPPIALEPGPDQRLAFLECIALAAAARARVAAAPRPVAGL